MKRKIFTTLLMLLIMPFSLMTVHVFADSYKDIIENIDSANEYYKQMNNKNFSDIMEAYNKFYDDHCQELLNGVPQSPELNTFFGCYYNVSGDNFLDVYLTSYDYLEYYQNYFSPDFTNYHIVKYSLFDLYNIKQKVEKNIIGNYNCTIGILDNSISFEVENVIDFNILKSISKNDNFKVVKAKIEKEKQRDIKGGDILYLNSGVSSATVTCNVYKSSTNQFGILTADHVLDNLSNSAQILIGNYVLNTKGNAKRAVDIDAAFIPNSNNNLSYTWKYSNINGTQQGTFNGTSAPLSGTTVCILGKSTNERYGKIVTNSTDNEIQYTFSGSATSAGDSGAPVVVFTQSGTNGRAWLVGIHCGIYTNQNKGYGCNIKTACSRFGVTVCS